MLTAWPEFRIFHIAMRDFARPRDRFGEWPDAYEVANLLLQRAAAGLMSAEEAMKKANEDIYKLMEEYGYYD